MRVLVLNTQMESAGAQRMASAVLRELRAEGHTAEWWCFYEKSAAYYELGDVRCLRASAPKTSGDHIALFFEYASDLREFRPDAVIAFTHYANVLGLAIARLCGVPIRIASQQNPLSSYPSGAKIADLIAGSLGIYSRNVMCSATVLQSFAKAPRSYLRRAVVIPNGAALTPAAQTKEEARRELGVPIEAQVMTSVGRLVAQKNQALLVRLLPHLPSHHLVIAGEGELRDSLRKLADTIGVANRLHLIGQVSPERMPTVLRATDVFVMPSLFEGLSLALLEAMSAELPIVASDVPSMRLVLAPANGEPAAALVPLESVDAWCEAIKRVAWDPHFARLIGRRAARIAGEYSPESSARKYLDELLTVSSEATTPTYSATPVS